MRLLAFTLASALPLLVPVAVQAADPPAVDLVSTFMLGARDGATVAFGGGQAIVQFKQTGPGAFTGTVQGSDGAPPITIDVHEKGTCVYDLIFAQGGQPGQGIELDATKLKSVSYQPGAASSGAWTQYTISLDGADGLVQAVDPAGALSPTTSSSDMGTSVPLADMQAAVATFQASDCKPPA